MEIASSCRACSCGHKITSPTSKAAKLGNSTFNETTILL